MGLRKDTLAFAGLLLAINVPFIAGLSPAPWVYAPQAVQAGEWWRVLSFPWVHVSWYHLLLDGVAFLMLYQGLGERRLIGRLTVILAAALGSLGAATIAAPNLAVTGLCGLSGIDHGLMAFTSLEMIFAKTANRQTPRVGLISLGLVVAKSVYEAITGTAFLSFLHFGLMGSPIAAGHAGGVLGGVAAFWILSAGWNRPRWRPAFPTSQFGLP
jgi:rhomboid family GlyGly-CTERM serine protease